MAKAFQSAAKRLRSLGSGSQTAAKAHNLNGKRKKSVGLGG